MAAWMCAASFGAQAQSKNPFADFDFSSNTEATSVDIFPLHPSGSVGLFHTFAALKQPASPKSLGLGFIGNYYLSKSFPDDPSIVERFMGAVQLNYTPIQYLELFGNLAVVTTNSEPPDNPLIRQVPNADFGFKVALPLTQTISVGGVYNGGYRATTSTIPGSSTALNHDFRAIATYDMTQTTPIRLHVNLGYAINNNARVTNASTNLREINILRAYPTNALVAALGAEYLTRYASFSFEYSIDYLQGASGYGYLDNPQRISLGARIFPTNDQSLSLTAGADIGGFATDAALGGFVEPKYALYFGFAYLFGMNSPNRNQASFDSPSNTFGTTQTPVSTTNDLPTKTGVSGGLLGFVSNIETGAPIAAATITFCNQTQTISDAQGQFSATDLPEGPCSVKLQHPAHQPMNDQVTIVGGKNTPFDFSMLSSATVSPTPAPVPAAKPQTTLMVAVQDASGQGIQADIRFENDTDQLPLQTDEFGKGTFDLPPGQYALYAKTNQGRESSTKYVLLKENDEKFIEFSLGKTKPKVKIAKDKKTINISEKVQFEVGKALLTYNSTKLLDEIATLLVRNPSVKRVKIAGHTDNTGNASVNLKLSQDRAQAVRDYLIKKGVDANRLEAAGYGEDFPIATNSTENGRYQNRRVDFRILKMD